MTEKKLCQGFLGVVRKGKVDQRYFVLYKDRLDYYNNVEDSFSNIEPRGRLALNDIEELEVLDNAFKIDLAGNPSRSLELQTQDPADLDKWIQALEPILDDGEPDNVAEKKEDKKAEPATKEDDEEVEVVLDGPLTVELNGQMIKKHFWLLADKLEYTNTDAEDEDVQESFQLSTICDLTATATGFSLMSSNRRLTFQCAKKDSDVWMSELQTALKSVSSSSQARPATPTISVTKPPEDQAKLSNNQAVSPKPSNDVPSTPDPKPLCEGELGILRKGRLDTRYFVLYDQSFEYWSNKTDYDSGDERRGCVVLADMKRLENTSTGFIVTLDGENRVLELRCDTEKELDKWLEQWKTVLDAKVCIISKLETKAAKPPDTNASKPLDNNVPTQEPKKEDSSSKSQIGKNLEFVQWKETEPNGVKVVFQSGRDLAKSDDLSCTAVVVGKPATKVETTKKSVPSWGEEFEIEEYGSNDSVEIQVLSGKEIIGKATLSADQLNEGVEGEIKLDSSVFSAGFIKLTAEVFHEERVVKQGELGIQKSKAVERRHFVLFLDRLEYFSSEADYTNGVDARGMIALQDVTNFVLSQEGFMLTLGGRTVSLHTTEQESQTSWKNAWMEVFEFKGTGVEELQVNTKAMAPPTTLEAKLTSTDQQVKEDASTFSIRFPDAPWPPPQNFKEELLKSLEALGVQQVAALSVEMKPGSVIAAFSGPRLALQELEKAPINLLNVQGYKTDATTRDGLICAGSLTIVRTDRKDNRYFALFDNRLDYFASSSDMEAKLDPRGRVLLRDIISLEFQESQFVLSLNNGKSLTLVPDAAQWKVWDLAWAQTEVQRKLGRPDESNAPKENTTPREAPIEKPTPKTPMEKPIPPKAPAKAKSTATSANERSKSPMTPVKAKSPPQKEAAKPASVPKNQVSPAAVSKNSNAPGRPPTNTMPSQDSGPNIPEGDSAAIPGALIEGQLGLQLPSIDGRGRLEARYFVVFPDRLDMFADVDSARNGQALESASKANIEQLDCVDDGFDISILGNPIKIRVMPGSGQDVQAWNNAFQQMFADDEQAQSAPPASRRNDTSPRLARRLMWQSMMEVSGGGVSEWRYCALYDDTFTSFISPNDMAEGLEPATRIPISRISDLEVMPQGFAMHLDTGDVISLRVSNEPGLHEAWITNWQKVYPNMRAMSLQQQMQVQMSPRQMQPQQQFQQQQQQTPAGFGRGRANLLKKPLSPSPARAGQGGQLPNNGGVLHEGVLELEKGNLVEMRYVVLYADRMENYKERSQFRRAERPKSIIKFESVQEFRSISLGFFIMYHDVAIRLHARTQPDFDEWSRALGNVFNLDGTEQGVHPIFQGTLNILIDGRQQRQHCILYPDRFEYTANSDEIGKVKIQAISGFRVSDQGFTIRLQNGEMELRAMNQRDLESWVNAFRIVFTGQGGSTAPPMSATQLPFGMSPNPAVSSSPGRPGARSASPQARSQQQNSMYQSPARGKENTVIYQGELGIQHGGKLTKKHFVLYPDRLDYFDTPVDAVSGKPTGRISLSEVANHEVFGCGLILDMLGRKVGLKAAHDSDVKQWDKMLKQAMASVRPPGFSPIPLSQRSTGRPRSTTPPRKVQPRVFDFMNQSSMSTNNQSTFVLSPISAQHDLTRSSSAPPSRNGDSSARSRSTTPPRGNVMHQDSEGWVQINTFIDPRHEGGRFWRVTDVGDTVNKREMCLKEAWHPRMYDVSPKLTGESRSLTPPRNDIAHKVNVPDEDSRLSIRRLNKERCARHGVPPKITTSTLGGKVTDRTFIKRESPDASYLKTTGKVNSMVPNTGAHMRFGADDR